VHQLAAVLRIKPLWRWCCCALVVWGYGEGGREGNPNFYPRPVRPRFS
jgi:hypothetical protein